MQFLSLYALAIPVFFVLDMLWLGVVARDFYQARLAHLMGEVQWGAAILFYLIFLVGLTFFAIWPNVNAAHLWQPFLYGALFGFFTYATYDLTNLATLRDWPLSVVIVDMLWGTVLGGTVATVTVWVSRILA